MDESQTEGAGRALLRRRIYLASLLGVLPLLGWVVAQGVTDQPFESLVYLALFAWFVPAGLALWRRPDWTEAIERATAAFLALLWTARLAMAAFLGDGSAATAPEVGMGLVLPVVLLFLACDTRKATIVTTVYVGATTALVLARVGGLGTEPTADGLALVLLRQQTFLLVLSGLIGGLANEKAAAATAERERAWYREKAYEDVLTELPNRRALDETLDRMLSQIDRDGRALSVIALDLDLFKALNDRYGHPSGDAALRTVARRVRRNVRDGDVFGRLGGDEFLILAPGADAEEAVTLAARCRRAIEAIQLEIEFELSASFGVATHRPGDSGSELIRRADVHLYRAKQSGRNRVEHDPIWRSAGDRSRAGRPSV